MQSLSLTASVADVSRELLLGSEQISFIGTRDAVYEDATKIIFAAKGLGVHEITVSGLEALQNDTQGLRYLIASRVADRCLSTAEQIIKQHS